MRQKAFVRGPSAFWIGLLLGGSYLACGCAESTSAADRPTNARGSQTTSSRAVQYEDGAYATDADQNIDWQDEGAVDRFISMQQPDAAPAPAPPQPSPQRSTAGLGLTVGGAAATSFVSAPLASAPYMIGDFFGGATVGGTSTITIPVGTIQGPPTGVFSPLGPDPIMGQVVFPEITFNGTTSQPTSVQTADEINQAFLAGGDTFALMEDPALTQAVQDSLGADAVAELANSQAQSVGQTGTPIVTSFSRFNLSSTYNVSEVIRLDIPSPASGGVVGRLKIAENGSPIPRDRVFFNYSFFDNVPLTSSGVNVNRFTPGFEKTFLNQMASVEMRFPFAATLDSNLAANGLTNTDHTEFGNIFITLKGLLASTETCAFSAGVSVTVPTADDISVRTATGSELVRIRNESVHIMPFLGALYTPNDRFFTQGFLQVDADANGSPVDGSLTGANLQRLGRLDDATFLFADVGVGYWLYQSYGSGSFLTGLAPTFELHYNRSLDPTDTVQSGGFQIGNYADNIEILNMVIGTTCQFGQNKFLTVGYATPLAGGTDRQFDGELRAFVNWMFGPSSRRTRAFF